MKQPRGSSFGVIAAMAALLLSGASKAATQDSVQLPTVVIVTTQSFSNLYGESSDPSFLAVRASPSYGMRYVNWDFYTEYKLFVAEAKVNPLTTPDVRCNQNATDTTKATTSRAAPTDRYVAAAQLFSVIRAVDGVASLRGLLKGNASYQYNGTTKFTFQITYADGGKERWIVENLMPGALVIEGNVPGSLSQGDGTVKSCSTMG